MSKNKKIKEYMKIASMVFFLFPFVWINNVIASTVTVEGKKWSFEFIDLSVSEALNKIRSISEVEIFLNSNIEMQSITKSYNNSSIDSILLDIFSSENHAVLFQYDDVGLAVINIWVLPQGESRALHSDIFNNNSVSLPMIENNRTHKFVNRSQRSKFRTIKNINKNKKLATSTKKTSYSSISLKKEDSSTSETVDSLPPPDTSEVVDIIPLPEIVTTLGLETPPMPPGLSF